MHCHVSARYVERDAQPTPVLRRVAEFDAPRQLPCRLEDVVEHSLGRRFEVVVSRTRHPCGGAPNSIRTRLEAQQPDEAMIDQVGLVLPWNAGE